MKAKPFPMWFVKNVPEIIALGVEASKSDPTGMYFILISPI